MHSPRFVRSQTDAHRRGDEHSPLLRSLLRSLLRRHHEQAQGGANAIVAGTGTTHKLHRLPTPEIHRHKMILPQNTVNIDVRTFATVF
eukprot:COSAG02_NODE_6552_length_3500_cov_56.166422_4_plen_87_part_01